MTYQIYNEDCVGGLKKLESDSIDLIFTDPPYGIDGDQLDAHYHRDESNVVPGYIDIPLDQYAQFSRDWITECARVLRPGGSIYIVSGYTNLHHVLNALHGTDLEEINHIIAQYSFGVSTKKKWVSSHYHVLFWSKPEKGQQKRTFNTNVFYTDQKDSYHDRLTVQAMPRDYKPGQIKNKNREELFDYYTNLQKNLECVRAEIDKLKQEAYDDLAYINEILVSKAETSQGAEKQAPVVVDDEEIKLNDEFETQVKLLNEKNQELERSLNFKSSKSPNK